MDIDLHKIIADLYGQDQPISKFAKDIGRSRQTVYRWLSKQVPMPKVVKKFLIMRLEERKQQ